MRNRQLIGYKYKLYQVKNEKGNTPTYPGVASRSKSYQQFLNQVIKVSTTSCANSYFLASQVVERK